MKRLLAIIAAAVMLAGAAIGAGSYMPMDSEVREEAVADFVANQVDLYLPSNPTTGYSWSCETEDPTLIAVRDQFFEDSNDLGFVGVGGTHWFHISGLKPGSTSVTFRYLRPWETEEAPAEETTYRLTVDEQLNVMIWGVEVA